MHLRQATGLSHISQKKQNNPDTGHLAVDRTIPQNRYDQISKLLSGSITASLSFYFPRSCITIFRTCLDSDTICSDSAIEALALDS
jgi:hypothetical protein